MLGLASIHHTLFDSAFRTKWNSSKSKAAIAFSISCFWSLSPQPLVTSKLLAARVESTSSEGLVYGTTGKKIEYRHVRGNSNPSLSDVMVGKLERVLFVHRPCSFPKALGRGWWLLVRRSTNFKYFNEDTS